MVEEWDISDKPLEDRKLALVVVPPFNKSEVSRTAQRDAAWKLKEKGYEPMICGGQSEKQRNTLEGLAWDVMTMAGCEAAYFGPDWHRFKKSQMLYTIADAYGLDIYTEDDLFKCGG